MSGRVQQSIRQVLRSKEDGMTLMEISHSLGKSEKIVLESLTGMPDAYIDRWQPAKSGSRKWAAVWCAVHVPENCPRPQ